jgi:hypothetical protein
LNQAVRDLKFPPELEEAVMRGLERQPADRQPTVTAFAEELARGVEGFSTKPKQGLFGSIKSFVKDRRSKD